MTRDELIKENAILRFKLKENSFTKVVNTLVITGGICLCFRFGYLSINALAGKSTLVDAYTSFNAGFSVQHKLDGVNKYILGYAACATIFAIACFSYARICYLAREKAIENFTPLQKQMETNFDPDRTSSGLAIKGKTNPKDKL